MPVELIHSIERLHAIKPEWDRLWQSLPQAAPFQHSGWILPWWDCFGSGRLFSFAVWEGETLAALALLFLHQWDGRRQVTFLGNGVSDHLDVLAGRPGQHAPAILAALAERSAEWDLCDLQDLPECSGMLQAPAPVGFEAEICPQYICSEIALPAAWKAYADALPHGLRRNLRRYRSQLASAGEVRIESAGTACFTEYLEALFNLHRCRWASKNEAGMLDGEAKERFHRVAARNLWDAGLARLHGIRLNGTLVAVVYAFVRGARAYSYLGGFAPDLARFSPGALILEYSIQQAMAEGVTIFDFLRGEESYKVDWGARRTLSHRLRLRHAPLSA